MRKSKPKPQFRRPAFRLERAAIAKVTAVVVITSLVFAVYQHLKGNAVFTVRDVITRQDGMLAHDKGTFVYLKGRNIFDLKLEEEARSIAASYPSYEQIRLVRFFPNQLFVDFLRRKPLACIRGSRTFYVDENCVLFSIPQDSAAPAVPVITGIERSVNGFVYGARSSNRELSLAMRIIKEIAANKGLRGFAVVRVDVPRADDASFFILVPKDATLYTKTDFVMPEQLLDIKIDHEDIRAQLGILATVLAQVGRNIYTIEYIDLRFKEPVIKFKGGK